MKNQRKFNKNKTNNDDNNNDSLAELAKKIRKDKVDLSEIQKIKNETMQIERQKNKRQRNIIKIQKAFRGYLSRKKFKNIMDNFNLNTIINYLKEKRKKRIQKNYQNIIFYYAKKFLQFQSIKKEKIIIAYLNYCSDLIKSTYLSFKVRKKMEPVRNLIKSKKIILQRAIFGYKTRMILRSMPIQNILTEIANIKYTLNNALANDQLQEDFKQRLPKLEISFYDRYYRMKKNLAYLDASRTAEPWILMYLSLIYKDNPKYKTLRSQAKKSTINIPNLRNPNLTTTNLQADYDNRPLPTMKNNFDENALNDNPDNSENPENPDDLQNRENRERENMSPNHFENTNPERNHYQDYENKPIKIKKIDYAHLFDDPNNNLLNDQMGGVEGTGDAPKKVIHRDKKPAKPKYDARKAIEEAKKKEEEKKAKGEIDPKAKDRNSFREFLKEMKKSNKKNKGNNDNQSPSKEPLNEINDKFEVQVEEGKDNKTLEKTENRRQRKEPASIIMRRKLHELERSPPPKLNLDKIKSKLSIKGSPERTKNKETNANTITNENSGNTNENTTIGKSSQTLNVKRVKKNVNVNENVLTFQKVETEIRKKIREKEAFFKEKEDKMKNYKKIPFIKPDSNFIKKYTPEDYDSILAELNKKYEEITNNN